MINKILYKFATTLLPEEAGTLNPNNLKNDYMLSNTLAAKCLWHLAELDFQLSRLVELVEAAYVFQLQ